MTKNTTKSKRVSKYRREEVPLLTEKEIDRRAKDIFEFLTLIHPSLENEKYKKVEVRFLGRSESGTFGNGNFSTWSFKEEDRQHLIQHLTQRNGYSVCTYYNLYAYEGFMNGKPTMMTTTKTSVYTEVLMVDFDGMEEEEFVKAKKKIDDLGIETVVVQSGHGYQMIFLLDEKNYDKELLRKFTQLLMKKGFKADDKILDSARIARLPFTNNCKAFAKGDKYYNPNDPKPIATSIYSTTTKRYNVDEIFEKIGSLEDVLFVDFVDIGEDDLEEYLANEIHEKTAAMQEESVLEDFLEEPKKDPKKKEKKEPAAKKKTAKNEKGKGLKTKEEVIKTEKYFAEAYKHFDFKILLSHFKHILMGVGEGVRNDALLFLIPFFKNELGLTLEKTKESMVVWGENCYPAFDKTFTENEVERLWKYDIKATYGRYTKELEEIYGSLDIVHEVISDRKIIIENKLFKSIDKLEGAALKIYLTIKMMEKEENKQKFTKEEIMQRANISERTLERGMKSLILTKLVNKNKSINKQRGEKTLFSINTLGSDVYGYTKLETSTVELMIIYNLSKLEMAFYVFMCAKTWSSTESVLSMSRETISDFIGSSSPTSITKITDKLHKLRFIRKETYKKNSTTYCEYTLLK